MKLENVPKAIELYSQYNQFKNELDTQMAGLASYENDLVKTKEQIIQQQQDIDLTQALLESSLKAISELD